jgi:hypothetical protein
MGSPGSEKPQPEIGWGSFMITLIEPSHATYFSQ